MVWRKALLPQKDRHSFIHYHRGGGRFLDSTKVIRLISAPDLNSSPPPFPEYILHRRGSGHFVAFPPAFLNSRAFYFFFDPSYRLPKRLESTPSAALPRLTSH